MQVLIETKEKIISFWVKSQPKILFLLICVGGVNFLRQLPYFNVTFTVALIGIFLWVVTLILFKLKSKLSLFAAIFAFLITGFAVAIEKGEIAQETANFAYYLDIIVFFQVLLESRNEKRKII